MTARGRAFRAWRLRKRLLTIDCAALMGVGLAQLSAWEVGREPWPADMAARVDRLLSDADGD